jgi:transposase
MSQKDEQDAKGKAAKKYLTSFQRKLLQKSLQPDLSDKLRQRIQIILLADEGKTQVQICQELGCCQATARHWITMARTNQAHHWNSKPIGRPTLVDEKYLQRLKQLVAQNPQEVNVPNQDYQYPFRRWTGQKLSQHLDEELGIKVTPQHLNRLLKNMGLSTRPKLTPETVINYPGDTFGDRDKKGIQIRDLETVSMLETSEVWNFNPFTNN